jgi:uncharacterized protein YndB with AHSA1/START domain
MTDSPASRFVYVSYIRATPERVWEALTKPEFTRQYWAGTHQECDWKPGASWRLIFSDGVVGDSGEILECDPPHRVVIKWHNQFRPELKAEGPTRCVIEIEAVEDSVKLTITHSIELPDAKIIAAVSGGWPKVVSNLKSLLETGDIALAEKISCRDPK